MIGNVSTLPTPALMLVTDRRLVGGQDALLRAVDEAVDGGVDLVQLREKDLPPEALLPLARRLRQVTSGRALLIVNGPLSVALACDADGLHLPEGAADVSRPGRPFLVGQSVHSQEAAVRAWSACRHYLVAGPVYVTPSHPGAAGCGAALIESVASAVAVPVLAIGGITPGRVEEVVRAGARGVAVISAILASPSPKAAAAALRAVLEMAWAEVGSTVP